MAVVAVTDPELIVLRTNRCEPVASRGPVTLQSLCSVYSMMRVR